MQKDSQILHILNGDSTRGALEEIGLEGEKVVFRDVLSDGPTLTEVGSDKFWKTRTDFMVKAFGPSPEEFKSYVIDEFDKLRDLSSYDEVVLWFEYDLFCQINMIAVMSFLLEHKPHSVGLSLVCSGNEDGFDRMMGLGELPLDRLPDLFQRRITISDEDLSYAKSVYQAYCAEDPRIIESALTDNSKFPYLKGALQAHYRRFPQRSNGLNEIERVMISLLEEGINDPRKLVGKMLQWQKSTYYGLGDTQYFNYLKRLQPLFDEEFRLNGNSASVIDRDYLLGGAKVENWVWNEDSETIQHKY